MPDFPFVEGSVVTLVNPSSGEEYEFVVWHALKVDDRNYSVIFRCVDEVI